MRAMASMAFTGRGSRGVGIAGLPCERPADGPASTIPQDCRSPRRALGVFSAPLQTGGPHAMSDTKAQLAKWIDDDREMIVRFLCDFVRAKSPNPPGDTTLAA